jgi:hypothetical protein
VLDEEFGRVGVPPQALASAQADPLGQEDAMFDRPGSKAPETFLTIATIIWRERGINRHEEFHIARSTRNFFWQYPQFRNVTKPRTFTFGEDAISSG